MCMFLSPDCLIFHLPLAYLRNLVVGEVYAYTFSSGLPVPELPLFNLRELSFLMLGTKVEEFLQGYQILHCKF